MKIGSIQVTVIDMVTFCGMMITLFTSILNLFQNTKSMYINNIIRCRLESVQEIKKSICLLKQLSSITNLKIMCRNKNDKMTFRSDLEKNITNIKLFLNPSRKLDKKIIICCESIKKYINNYIFIYYLNKEISINDNILENFKKALYTINDRCFFQELIMMYRQNYDIHIEKDELLKIINNIYNNKNIIKKKLSNYDKIMQNYEDNIEKINRELDYLIYLYIELKWIRCKKEMKMWPFNKFNEKKEIRKLLD